MKTDAKANLASYFEYNKTLRAWLVGFGFGVPALFLVNPVAQKTFLRAPNAELIIRLFLIGSGAQIVVALLNKIVAWCAYRKATVEDSNKLSKSVHVFASLENVFAIDVALDMVSLAAFGVSLYLLFGVFLAAAQLEPATLLR